MDDSHKSYKIGSLIDFAEYFDVFVPIEVFFSPLFCFVDRQGFDSASCARCVPAIFRPLGGGTALSEVSGNRHFIWNYNTLLLMIFVNAATASS